MWTGKEPIIKKYEGKTYKEALSKTIDDLGKDAVLIHTISCTPKGIMKLFRKSKHYIIAGKGFHIVRDLKSQNERRRKNVKEETTQIYLPFINDLNRRNIPQNAAATDRTFESIKNLLTEIRDFLKDRFPFELPCELQKVAKKLLERGVSHDLSKRIILKLNEKFDHDSDDIHISLFSEIKNLLPVCRPIKLKQNAPVVVMLVGPTGVGKTTTLAKIAGKLALKRIVSERKKVAAITVDNYRIAAKDQLQKMAEIMHIPFLTVCEPQDAVNNIRRLKEKEIDLILIDTPGTSQRNNDMLGRLEKFINIIKPDEVHLALSMTDCCERQFKVIDSFSRCKPDHFIFTKLDEAVKPGQLLDVLEKRRCEISYVTTGQEIPIDFEEATQDGLAKIILGEN